MFAPGVTQTVGPATLAVSLDDAKAHLRVDGSTDNALITAYLEAAISHVENYLSASLITRTLQMKFESWPDLGGGLELFRGPTQAVSSIAYLDENDASQTLSASVYQVLTTVTPTVIMLAPRQSWPTLSLYELPVTVTYTAGYGDTAATIPKPIRQAILLTLGDLYRDREAGSAGVTINPISTTVEKLLNPYVRHWFA